MSTFNRTATDAAYSNMGTGPLYLEVTNHERGRLFVGAAQPAVGNTAWIPVQKGNPFSYEGTENVYILKEPGAEDLQAVVVEVR